MEICYKSSPSSARCSVTRRSGDPRRTRNSRAATAHPPHSTAPPWAGAARRDSGPAPLLPGRTRSLRSASVIPASPPPRGAPRVRPGSLQLHSAQTKGGKPFPEVKQGKLTVPMAVEGASKTITHDRGRYPGRRAPRGPREYSAVAAALGSARFRPWCHASVTGDGRLPAGRSCGPVADQLVQPFVLSWPVNAVHVAAVKASRVPPGSLLSRTATARSVAAISMQLPPLLPL